MPYIGKQPSKVPLTSADIVDGTISNDDLAGSITDAKIVGLTASKLSGVVPTANLGTGTASSSTVLYGDGSYKAEPVTDTTSIKNDISLLALQNAISGNLSAYGLKNSWIEQFEDSTYIENLTTCARYPDEYMSAGDVVMTARAVSAKASHGNFTTAGNASDMTNGDANDHTTAVTGPQNANNSTTGGGVSVDMGSNQLISVLDWGSYRTNGTSTKMKLWHSTDNSSWSAWDSSNASGSTIIESHYSGGTGSTNAFVSGGADGVIVTSGHSGNGHVSIIKITGLAEITTRYVKVTLEEIVPAGSDYTTGFTEIKPYGNNYTTNATGSFNSTDVVPQDATNKSSVGLVLLYKDNGSSSCTLNTDVIAKVRANTGQAYQTLSLAGAGTYSDSLKIAIAPAISVTAGQALSYEISFANQSAGTKEARIHGVAMTY